ncbi:MAG TPA: type II CAAX endopeptidase family protein [Polyangiaceae bacterium]|jgi:membrane protease YdiL (CAAX protease family)
MTALFFALAFALTWGVQLPALLAHLGVVSGPPERYMALVGLGAFGPMAAAMIAGRVERAPGRPLFRKLQISRVGARWYLAALLLPGGIFVLAAATWNALGHAEPLFYLPDRPEFVAAAIVFPFGEEVGWRGFALPRLLERHGPLKASVILGLFWTVWHVPMLTLQGVPLPLYAVLVPFFVGGSVLFTWIYRHTRGSLLLAVLTHVGAHLNNPAHALPGRATPVVIHAASYGLLAALLVRLDRPGWLTPNPAIRSTRLMSPRAETPDLSAQDHHFR